MSKITMSGLRKIIREELVRALNENDEFGDHEFSGGRSDSGSSFGREELRMKCPQAEKGLSRPVGNTGEELDPSVFWVMHSPDDTNESELTDELSGSWDRVSCDGVVYCCGDSVDDEYGYYWDNSARKWVSYNF